MLLLRMIWFNMEILSAALSLINTILCLNVWRLFDFCVIKNINNDWTGLKNRTLTS